MKKDKIIIYKREYKKLKIPKKIDFELITQFKKSLKDLKEGRIRRVA
ncbi:MAG: hypothetical protein AABX54_01860 [Nanoarchaeota archaeon]